MKKIIYIIISFMLFNTICGFTSASFYRENAKEDYLLKPQYIITATYSDIMKNKINEQILWLMNNNHANYAMYLSGLLTKENYINGFNKQYQMNGGVDLTIALSELFDIGEQGILNVFIDDFDNDKTNELCILRLERVIKKEYDEYYKKEFDDIKYDLSLQIVDEETYGQIVLSNKKTLYLNKIFEDPVFEFCFGTRKNNDINTIYCNCYGYWNFHLNDGELTELQTLVYDGTSLREGMRITGGDLPAEDDRTIEEENNLKEKAKLFIDSQKIPNINTIEELFAKMEGDIIDKTNGFSDIYVLRRTPNGEKFIMSSELGYYDESNAHLYDIYYNNGTKYVLTFSNQ